jgi:hypothetical protein
VGSGCSEPSFWAEPAPGPSGWDIAGLAVIVSKPATPNVVVTARRDNAAALISLRTVLCSMVSPVIV